MMRIPALFLRDSNQNPPKLPKKFRVKSMLYTYNIPMVILWGASFFWGGEKGKKDLFPFRRPGPESSTLARACNEVCVCVIFMLEPGDTVDGQNPAPPGMVKTL